ncbi:hypothetical protein ACEQ8H_006523 [Pleosporales sp. CAS-2024a]
MVAEDAEHNSTVKSPLSNIDLAHRTISSGNFGNDGVNTLHAAQLVHQQRSILMYNDYPRVQGDDDYDSCTADQHHRRKKIGFIGISMWGALGQLEDVLNVASPPMSGLLHSLKHAVEDSTQRPIPILASAFHALFEVLQNEAIDGHAITASRVLVAFEPLLSFPEAQVRARSIRLVNLWRSRIGAPSLDRDVVSSAKLSNRELSTLSASADHDNISWNHVLEDLVHSIEQSRSMDSMALAEGRRSLDMLLTSHMSLNMLKNSSIISDIQNLDGHPDRHIRDSCAKLAHFWRCTLITQREVKVKIVGRRSKGHGHAKDDHIASSKNLPMPPPSSEEYDDSADLSSNNLPEAQAIDYQPENGDLANPESASEPEGIRYDLGDVDQFLNWVVEFTAMDKVTFLNVKTELEDLHTSWSFVHSILEINQEERTQGHVMCDSAPDNIEHHDDTPVSVATSIDESDRVPIQVEMEKRSAEDVIGSLQEAHKEVMIKMFIQFKRILKDFDGQSQAWTEILGKKEEFIQLLVGDGKVLEIQQDPVYTALADRYLIVQSELAKLKTDMEKQSSKYYQDVEKGVSENSSALQQQLKTARAEASLYRQTLAEKELLQKEVLKLKQENTQLNVVKCQKEAECKSAEAATAIVTEGYDQLKKTVQDLEASNIELHADNDQLLQERNDLHTKLTATMSSLSAATPPAAEAMSDHSSHGQLPITTTPTSTETSVEEKRAKELQHLDNTIIVWENTLKTTTANTHKTRVKKQELDAQVAQLEMQITAIKKQAKNKIPPAPEIRSDDDTAVSTSVPPPPSSSSSSLAHLVRRAAVQPGFPRLASRSTLGVQRKGIASMRIVPGLSYEAALTRKKDRQSGLEPGA